MTHSFVTAPAVLLAFAASASAQSLFQQYGEVVLASGQQAPGLPIGYTIKGSSTQFDPPVMDQNGGILFRGQFEDLGAVGGLTTSNDRALFFGRASGDVTAVVRADDPAPVTPAGATFRSNSATAGSGTFAQSGCYRISPFSQFLFFRSNIYDAATPANTPATSDEALFWGPVGGSLLQVCREGEQVPFFGPASGIFWGTMSSSSWMQEQQMNDSGQITVANVMTGAVTTSNDSILVTGFPGNLVVISREGDTLASDGGLLVGGEVVTVASGSFLAGDPVINEAGQVLHDMKFSSTTGTATVANDIAIGLWDGTTDHVIAREGMPAPGFPGGSGVLWASPSNGWAVNVGSAHATFNRGGKTLLLAQLNGGTVTANVDDFAFYIGGLAGWTKVVQRNDAAPASLGVGVTYGQFSGSTSSLSNDDFVAFATQLNNTAAGTLDNTALIYGTTGNLRAIAHEGDQVVADGLLGGPWYFGDLFNTGNPRINDRGQVYYQAPLKTSATATSNAKTVGLGYDPQVGWRCLWDTVDTVSNPLGSGTIASTQTNGFNSSGDGSGCCFFDANGDWGIKMTLAPSSLGAVIGRGHVGTMVCEPSSVPATGGVAQNFHIDCGPGLAFNFYFVLASGVGTRPGFPNPLNPALTVPLNPGGSPDWFQLSFELCDTAVWVNTLFYTDANGRATASFLMPPGIPGFQGTTLHHAAVLFDTTLAGTYVTEPSALKMY